MALKFKITKKAYEALSDEIKSEYRAEGDNYILDVDGLEDTSALKRARDREKERADEFKTKLEEAEEKIDTLEKTGGKTSKDIDTLTKAHEKKIKELTDSSSAKIEKLTSFAKKNLIDRTATEIATKISTVPNLMAKAIKERLTVDLEGDEPALKILDSKGNVSEMTLEQLSEEFVANKEFSGIIVGSKASGSGAGKDGLNKSNGGGAGSQQDKPASLASMSPQQLAEHMKAKKEAGQ